MNKEKKYMVEYLDLGDGLYIENDTVKIRYVEGEEPRECTWKEMRDGVMEIIEKVRKYDEEHNRSVGQ